MVNLPRQEHDAMMVEVASLFHLLEGMAPRHLNLIGGLVPPLLVPSPAPRHRGSGDIDLTLSVAITIGATADYYKSIEDLLSPYFDPSDSNFRWRKREDAPGLPLLVDFMGPENEATQIADGTLQLEDDTAAENVGPRLRPMPLRAAGIVDRDAVTRRIEGVELVYKAGKRADVDIRHAGPVGFLASKGDAFSTRDDSKDGYDVAWCCIHIDDDPAVVAGKVIEREAFKDEYFQESVATLLGAFKAPDYIGPSGYADEEHPEEGPGDQVYEEARNLAFSAVRPVLEGLKAALWQ